MTSAHNGRYVVDYDWHCVAGFRTTARRRLLTGRTGRTLVFSTLTDAENAASKLLNGKVWPLDQYDRHARHT